MHGRISHFNHNNSMQLPNLPARTQPAPRPHYKQHSYMSTTPHHTPHICYRQSRSPCRMRHHMPRTRACTARTPHGRSACTSSRRTAPLRRRTRHTSPAPSLVAVPPVVVPTSVQHAVCSRPLARVFADSSWLVVAHPKTRAASATPSTGMVVFEVPFSTQ